MKMIINLIIALLFLLPQGAAAFCVQGDCVNGQGTVVLPDGRRYVGEFQDGIRTGRGLMTFPDGTKYLGDWKNDKPHGQGTLSSVGKFEYAGEFANGVRDGQGTLATVDGKMYIGQWQNDVPHGQGKIIYPDGASFVGQFKTGRRNGQGEAIYTDKTKYIGQWKDDLPNGYGTKIFADGVKYTGEFRNGLMHGQGTILNPDGSRFTGQWQDEVLVKKEEVVKEAETLTAEKSQGHVLAVVDDKTAATPIAAGVSEAAVDTPPLAPTVNIVNTRAGYFSVNQNGVIIRSGPSTKYRVIRTVNRGFPVQLISQEDKWSYIKDFVGQEGWIYSTFLGSNDSAIVRVSKANLRSGPGLNFMLVNQVEFGTVLQVNNIKNRWYMVTTAGGMKAWISRELLWPAGHGVADSQEVLQVAAISPKGDKQPAQAVAPAVKDMIEETATPVQVDAPAIVSEPDVAIPEGDVESKEAPKEAFASDEAVETTPPESVANSVTKPVEPVVAGVYAGIVQNDRGANIRSAPLFASDVLRSVPPGFPLAVIEYQGEWVLVEDFRKRRGWVYARLLTDLQSAVIKVGKGNLRNGPSLIEGIVAKLDYGAVIFIDETRGDWLKVSNPEGLAGWLHRYVVWP